MLWFILLQQITEFPWGRIKADLSSVENDETHPTYRYISKEAILPVVGSVRWLGLESEAKSTSAMCQ